MDWWFNIGFKRLETLEVDKTFSHESNLPKSRTQTSLEDVLFSIYDKIFSLDKT